MTLSKIIPALSLAVAMIGGAVLIAPSYVKADSGHISNGALGHDRISCSDRATKNNCRPGTPANPHTRGCSAIFRCRG
jgi:hypothetical protein